MLTTKMSKSRFSFRSLPGRCAVLCLLLCSFTVALAQQEKSPQRGFQPGGSYAISDIETISTTGGNLSLNVPLAGLPAGRGGLKASVSLVYNSKLWDSFPFELPTYPNSYEQTRLRASDDGGWRYSFKYALKLEDKHFGGYDGDPCTQADGRFMHKLMLTLPDGSKHEMIMDGMHSSGGYTDIKPDGSVTCGLAMPETGTLHYYSGDSTFLRLDVEHDADTNWENNPWTLYLPDGGRVVTAQNAPQRIYDRNDNYVEIAGGTYNGHAATYLSDQVGRSVIIEYDSAQNQDSIHVRGTGNELMTTTVVWTNIQVNKSYQPGGPPAPLSKSFRVVSQIILPSQAGSALFYDFGYNAGTTNPSYGWGEVSSIKLPSGARASYQYFRDNVHSGIGAENVLANYPTRKDLVYRAEYDLTGPVSNAPCAAAEPCVTETTTYDMAFAGSEVATTTITAPNGGVTREHVGTVAGPDYGRVYKTEMADGTVVERQWQSNVPQGSSVNSPVNSPNGLNQYVKREFTSIRGAAGNMVKTAVKEYSQDKNGHTIEVKEYDWLAYANGGGVQRDGNDRPYGVSGVQPKRITNSAYHAATPDASDTATVDGDTYNKTTSPRLLHAVVSTEIGNGMQMLSRAEFAYDNAATTGNLTQQKSWDSTKGSSSNPLNYITTSAQYGSYGNPTLTTDARGTQTHYTYDAVNGHVNLYPTTIKVAYGTAIEQATTREYDFYTGALTRSTDPNNVATETAYDVFGRPMLVKAAAGITSKETRTATEYSDTQRRVIVRSDLTNTGDGKLVSVEHYDQLGRIRLSRRLENAAAESAPEETAGIKVQTRYLNSGQNSYTLVSNPYRATSSSAASAEPSMGWTRSKSDTGGRAIETQTFHGATLPAPWDTNASSSGAVTTAYDAEFTTVTDQTGRARRSMMNGLGQLARVDEPDKVTGSLGSAASPVQPTSYTYDGLGNLTQVTQGTQTRTYNYSSLSRLASATNPESGTVSYTYDAGGNLVTKTDARAVTITYGYDALSRNKTVDYSNTTLVNPDIERHYDNPASGMHGRGRFWKDYKGGNDSTGGEVEHRVVDAYDALGRPLTQRQKFKAGGIWSADYTTHRSYTRAGQVETQTLPSGHTVSHTYDAAGRLQNFSGNLGDDVTRTYSTGATYDAAGRMTREQFGTQTPLFHQRGYNVRGQMCKVALGTSATSLNRGLLLFYYSQVNGYSGCASGPDNNGNMVLSQHWVPNDEQISGWQWFNQYYTYDSLNRIGSVREEQNAAVTTGEQHYTYDRWGNRQINAAATYNNNPSLPFNEKQFDERALATENRLHAPGDLDAGKPESQRLMRYDAAGNLTEDRHTGMGARTYDAENRMTSAVSDIYGNSSVYTYDADGRRTRRHTPTGNVWQVYGIDGELLAEYAAGASPSAPQKEYGYRNGELLVTAEVASTASSAVPSNLSAAPRYAGTQIKLGWDEVPGATRYRVERATSKGPDSFTLWRTSEPNSFEDAAVTGGQAYLYRVCAADGAGNCTSGYGNVALATAYGFADDPLITLADDPTGATVTRVRALHVEQLRAAVDAVRVLAGLNTGAWDQTAVVGGLIRAAHVQELRTRLNEALVELSMPLPAYRDAVLSVGVTSIKRAHIEDLRVYATRGSGAGQGGGTGGTPNIQWLVTDHLGTPRIIADLSGSLVGIKRHDYLPFGEELGAGIGGRTTGQGYVADNVRQQFTGYERDDETGLDYAQARYYANTQGRFTSPDPLLSTGSVDDAQTWNRYSYALNNPLRYTDPSGMYVFGSSVSETQQGQFNAALDKAREDLKKYGQLYGTDSDTYKKAQKALEAYGKKGVDNGVTINAAETIDKGAGGGVDPKIGTTAVTPDNPNGQKINVAFTNDAFGSETFGSLIGHEGAHVSDASAWVKSGFAPSMNPTWYQTEMDGYAVQGLLSQASNPNRNASIWDPGYGGKKGPMRLPGFVYLYKTSWEQADIARLRATNVKNYLANPVDQNGSYELTPDKTPKAFVKSRSKR